MNERTIVKSLVGLLAFILILAAGNTDLIYIGASVLFFTGCIAFAAWCERL
jgi:hypothetical protein